MRFKVRNSAFETNSSSMHALVVKKVGDLMTPAEYMESNNRLPIDELGYIHIENFSWGRRPFKICYTPYDKLRYIFGSMVEERYDEDTKKWGYDFTVDDNNVISINDNPSFDALINVIKTYEPTFKGFTASPDPCFYVPGDIECVVNSGNLSVEYITDIIFNTRNIFVVDGDEYCDLDNAVDAGLIDGSMIEIK